MAITTQQMMTQLEEMRPHLDSKITTGMDALADLPEAVQASLVPALYKMMEDAKAEIEAEQKKKKTEDEKVEEAWKAWVAGVVEGGEECALDWMEKLEQDENLQTAAAILLMEQHKKITEIVKSKGKKKKGSGTRAKASGDVEVWVTNTEEDAKNRYDDVKEGWTTVKDYENKTVYLEIVKLYKAGQKDPRPEGHPDRNGDILTTDLHKKKWTPVVREGEMGFQSTCPERCCGAKVWKQGRNASLYCADEGIKSATVMLCSGTKEDGSDFCKVCVKKSVNFWEGEYGTKGSGKMWHNYLKGDVVVNLSLENA